MVGRAHRGQNGEDRIEVVGRDVELDEHLAPRLERALQERQDLLHGMALLGVRGRRGVGDELGVRHEERLDHLQAGRAQCAPRLGHVDDSVRDVGHLGLGGAIGHGDVRIDAVCGQRLARQLGVLGADPEAPGPSGRHRGQFGQRADRRVGAHGQDHPGRIRRHLGVRQLAERDDLAPPLLDAVAPGDAEVEEPVGHVDRDFLGSQDAHVADAGIGDRGAVGHIRGTVDSQVGVLEELHGGAFERALGQDEAEHGLDLRRPAAGVAPRSRVVGS